MEEARLENAAGSGFSLTPVLDVRGGCELVTDKPNDEVRLKPDPRARSKRHVLALVFGVALDHVPCADRLGDVLLALEIPVDPVRRERNRAEVVEELDVAL